MILNKIEDPRDQLRKMRRRELFDACVANGITHIMGGIPVTDGAPADLLRAELRSRGLTRFTNIPARPLGAMNQPGTGLKYQNRMQSPGMTKPPQGIEADAIADLKRQFEAQQKQHAAAAAWRSELAKMGINDLGNEMKRLKIKRERRDNMESMRAKITAYREAHG